MSHHGAALSDGSEFVMTELYRGARAWDDVHNREDTLDLSSSTKEHFADSIKTTITLCKEYPSTVDRFSSIAKALNDDKVDPDPTSLPRMYFIETRFAERALGSHILGQLETCQTGHPNVVFMRIAKFLHEDKFWEQMTRCGPS